MTKTAVKPREQWSGQLGFLFAAIGSAVGLGNIWRFPGVAYTNGGGAFLIPYVVALLTAGVPVLLLDYAVGHRYRGSAPAALRRVNARLESLGWFQVTICFVIATYYAVVLAWAISYFVFSLNLAWGEDPISFFTTKYLNLSEPAFTLNLDWPVFIPLVILWACLTIVMALGIRKGIELANRIAVPLLIFMFLALVVQALFLPGALKGLDAFFTPNWASLTDPNVWIAAYGQIFFSLSVAFGIMLTYSSYLSRKANLIPTSYVAAFANSSFELLAGIGVFAALGFMATQNNSSVSDLKGISGVALSFMTFPKVISQMPGGPLFGALFFLSLILAGATSLVSVIQVVSAALQEKLNLSPKTGALAVCLPAAVVSIVLFATTNGLNALDVVDKFSTEIGVVTSAILSCVALTYIFKKLPEFKTHLNETSTAKIGSWWSFMIAILTPALLIYMLISQLIILSTKGYGNYSATFLLSHGWGILAVVLAITALFTMIRWRTPVDDFTPDSLPLRKDAA